MAQGCLAGDLRDLVDQVLDKWSLSILAALSAEPRRFNELRREVPDITQKSLAQTLKRLERNGLVERHVRQTRPLAVGYEITPLGRSLEAPLEHLAAWATARFEQVERAREQWDAEVRALQPTG